MLERGVSKIQQTKMLVTCKRFGDLFLFGLVWQHSSVQTKYNKGRFKVMANVRSVKKNTKHRSNTLVHFVSLFMERTFHPKRLSKRGVLKIY